MDFHSSNKYQPQLLRSLTNIFTFLGIGATILGIFNFTWALAEEATGFSLSDALFNLVAGILFIVCSRFLANGSRTAIPLYGGIVVAYIFFGPGFNLIFFTLSTVIFAALVWLWRQGELT